MGLIWQEQDKSLRLKRASDTLHVHFVPIQQLDSRKENSHVEELNSETESGLARSAAVFIARTIEIISNRNRKSTVPWDLRMYKAISYTNIRYKKIKSWNVYREKIIQTRD